MAPRYPDVIPVIEKWLSENHERICSFWVGADWRLWARYELFMCLESAFGDQCVVTHGVPIWKDSHEETDILLEPFDSAVSPLALKLRCERVSENEGSYERFRDQMNQDMARLRALGGVESEFEGGVMHLIGFSGEPSSEDHEFEGESQPKHFQAGEVHGWVTKRDLAQYSTEQSDDRQTMQSAKTLEDALNTVQLDSKV